MDTAVVTACGRGSFAGMPFPEVVRLLSAAGAERYSCDLVQCQKTVFDQRGTACVEHLPLADAPAIGDRFDEAAVVAALRTVQRGEIGYAEFLRRIMTAGVVRYDVYLAGRRAIYVGRYGGYYVEPFPPGLGEPSPACRTVRHPVMSESR